MKTKANIPQFSHEEKEFLVTEIQQYPVLYDNEEKEYKNNNAKMNAWAEIKRKFAECLEKSYCKYIFPKI